MFSKSEKIREAGKHMRYRPDQFELTGPVDWAPAENVLPFSTMRKYFRNRISKMFVIKVILTNITLTHMYAYLYKRLFKLF